VFNTAHIGKPGAPDSERVELRAGVWRYHPVRHEFEVFAHGGSNQWGLDYDEHGQLFMTHCRSYWGGGCTTHVIQGGHYWNQANANYAPFIIANPPKDFPGFRNYLLASAHYDHGAGGAGKPGSDAIYGGHSHVGTMIYLGDNWPEEYRGHLFTHNLGGHQINHQVNLRVGSGFDTIHAGKDMFFCSDPKYVAVDLQYGPDGAVYIIDWYDQQHCHNPNTERWDRGNGRIYRMQWQATYKPVKVDLSKLSDDQLVELQKHKNEWYVRTARRLLHERSLTRRIEPLLRQKLRNTVEKHPDPIQRLRALWTLYPVRRSLDESFGDKVHSDADEFVRGWAIQLQANDRKFPTGWGESERVFSGPWSPNPVDRLYIASAVQRVNANFAWPLIEQLAQVTYRGRGWYDEDRADPNLPFLLWQGIAQRMPNNLDHAFKIAESTRIPQLADWIYWYAATFEGDPLNRVIALLEKADGELLRRRLAGLWLAMESRANVPMPPAWKKVAPKLYANKDARVVRPAERLAAVFGDTSTFPRLREALADVKADADLRKHAFGVLSRALDQASLPIFLRLLDDKAFRSDTINLLSRFDRPEVASELLKRFEGFTTAERSAALNTLTSRSSFALALLDAIGADQLKRDQLTAFHIRQLTQLKSAEVDKRVAATWGKLHQSPAEKQTQIARLEKTFDEAPLWAYDAGAGREHFQKLCAQCHRMGDIGVRVGPELTGAGKNGIRYFLENIIDPDAVIGADFQMTTVETRNGETISGLVNSETPSALGLRTTIGETSVAKVDIARRVASEKSLMPEGLLESLNEREQLELLKFLTTN
jgi:putative heme-binding domain-containing protein